MPEVRDHYERQYYAIKLGGWRLGKRTLGGGTYTVGPISVTDCMALFRVVKDTDAKLAERPEESKLLMERMPWVALKPMLPLIVKERIKPRHMKAAGAAQVIAALNAFYKANDFEYITKAFTRDETNRSAKRMSLDMLIHYLQTQCRVYTHAQIRKLPIQEVLAIIDDDAALRKLQEPEKEEEKTLLTPDDYALFRDAGISTVH